MELDDLLEKYKKVTKQTMDIDTFNNFSKRFEKTLQRQPVIYMLFQKYSLADRRKFLLELKINRMGITKLNAIVNLEYKPGLYREFFLHPYYEIWENELDPNYGGMRQVLQKKVTEDGWERLVVDSEYINAYKTMYTMNEGDGYSWVDIRWRMVDDFISRRELKRDIVWLGANYKDKFEPTLDKNLKKNVFFEEVLEWIALEEEMEKKIESLKEAKIPAKEKKNEIKKINEKALTSKESVLGAQLEIDIFAARDFWCAFLIVQSTIKQISEEYKIAKKQKCFCRSKNLYLPKDSMEEAYLTVWGKWNQEDFNIRKKYAEIVMQLTNMNPVAQEIALRQPATWLSGDNIMQKGKAKIKSPRNVHLGKDKYRSDDAEYNKDILRKKIVDNWDDEDILYGRAVNMELLSISAHINDMYCRFDKTQVDMYFDVYIKLYKIVSYLLLVYDEMDFYYELSQLYNIWKDTVCELETEDCKGNRDK